ncbi:hypothetical protein TNCT_168611 [Trichonephila clavata]|uniref:FAD dependent oxidoreductase domain-containing protein n=1 Tax=Trichonephila clavata TaxID=2740835 RepID=A0A8X6HKU4_TRICU|nr:hypothetical protein TNCT_168611 [Trichonephila clavata]
MRDKTPQDPKIEKKIEGLRERSLSLLESEAVYCGSLHVHAGFSGSGFKTSPVVGKLLSQMAMGTETFLDISPFSPSRFLQKK